MTHFDIVPLDPGDQRQVRSRLAVAEAVEAHDRPGNALVLRTLSPR